MKEERGKRGRVGGAQKTRKPGGHFYTYDRKVFGMWFCPGLQLKLSPNIYSNSLPQPFITKGTLG